MHGTQLGPGYKTPVGLNPNPGATVANQVGSATTARSTIPADDPRRKAYVEG